LWTGQAFALAETFLVGFLRLAALLAALLRAFDLLALFANFPSRHQEEQNEERELTTSVPWSLLEQELIHDSCDCDTGQCKVDLVEEVKAI
jgi:hypothetical protein